MRARSLPAETVLATKGWCRADPLAEPLRLAAEYLEARGATLSDFESAGGEVVADASQLDGAYPAGPALVFRFFDPLSGEALSYLDSYNQRQPFHRIKPLGMRSSGGAKFLQPKSSGTHVFFAQHPVADWPATLGDTSRGIVLTEGETRSLAGAARELAVISVTGVDCGQVDGQLHPDLAVVPWRGRQVFFAFDSDVQGKEGPRKALQRLAALLRQQGAHVFDVPVPPNPDGSKQGLDDFLAQHGPETFMALVASPATHLMAGAEEYEPPVLLADLMAATYPPTEWAWENLILQGEVNLLSGDGGVGKSLLALYLAVAVAAGKPLFGDATRQMPVLGLFAEDGAAQVQQRVRTILSEFGLDFSGDLPIKLWCQPRGDVTLAQIEDTGVVKELPRLHALRAELAELQSQGFRALLILDSLADLFALNESLRLPVNAALKQVLGGLCGDFGVTVLVLMHPSKTSMHDGTHYSGSTAFNNAVRQRLTVELMPREKGDISEGPPPRILKVAKSNYGPKSEKTLWYYGATIAALPRGVPTDSTQDAWFRQACVSAATHAAKLGVAFTMQRLIPECSMDEISKAIGRRPRQAEVKRELDAAVHAGLLRYVKGTNRARAGYYPADEETAKGLARQAKGGRP